MEGACGAFTASFAKFLPVSLHPLAFCTPASFRDPESDDVWHPFLLKKSGQVVMMHQLMPLARSVFSGLKRWILAKFGTVKFLHASGAEVLAVGPELICPIIGGWVRTSYVSQRDLHRLNWLVVAEGKDGNFIPRKELFVHLRYLIHAWWNALKSVDVNKHTSIASLLVLRWILSLSWVVQYYWLQGIRNAVRESRPRALFCVHEMHPLARLVWHVAWEEGLESLTVQHATITRSKLWYFSTLAEREAGLNFPKRFDVYSNETLALMRSMLPERVQMGLSCGPRYVHWKSGIEVRSRQGSGILFVTSLAWWDNDVIFRAIFKLLRDKNTSLSICLRLHPNAKIRITHRSRLKLWELLKEIHVSNGSVKDDFLNASVVVGATTTLLAEAALYGLRTISLSCSDYNYSPMEADCSLEVDYFDSTFVNQVQRNSQVGTQKLYRKLLGIEQPDFLIIEEVDEVDINEIS